MRAIGVAIGWGIAFIAPAAQQTGCSGAGFGLALLIRHRFPGPLIRDVGRNTKISTKLCEHGFHAGFIAFLSALRAFILPGIIMV
jgi:hypothetical protein